MPMNKVPVRPDSRNVVFDIVDGERDYQDEQWSAAERQLTPGEYLILMEEYVAKARATWVKEHGDVGLRNAFRKWAGIAVRAMEQHGALPREFHVPVSANIVGTMQAHDPGDALDPNDARSSF